MANVTRWIDYIPHEKDGESEDLQSSGRLGRAAARAVIEIHSFVAVHVHYHLWRESIGIIEKNLFFFPFLSPERDVLK